MGGPLGTDMYDRSTVASRRSSSRPEMVMCCTGPDSRFGFNGLLPVAGGEESRLCGRDATDMCVYEKEQWILPPTPGQLPAAGSRRTAPAQQQKGTGQQATLRAMACHELRSSGTCCTALTSQVRSLCYQSGRRRDRATASEHLL